MSRSALWTLGFIFDMAYFFLTALCLDINQKQSIIIKTVIIKFCNKYIIGRERTVKNMAYFFLTALCLDINQKQSIIIKTVIIKFCNKYIIGRERTVKNMPQNLSNFNSCLYFHSITNKLFLNSFRNYSIFKRYFSMQDIIPYKVHESNLSVISFIHIEVRVRYSPSSVLWMNSIINNLNFTKIIPYFNSLQRYSGCQYFRIKWGKFIIQNVWH